MLVDERILLSPPLRSETMPLARHDGESLYDYIMRRDQFYTVRDLLRDVRDCSHDPEQAIHFHVKAIHLNRRWPAK